MEVKWAHGQLNNWSTLRRRMIDGDDLWYGSASLILYMRVQGLRIRTQLHSAGLNVRGWNEKHQGSGS